MKRTIAFLAAMFLAAIAFCAVGSVYGLYEVSNEGTWPKSWPEELDPLRKQSLTFELVVDGDIVDLNRIPLPEDTPIIDERFKDRRNK